MHALDDGYVSQPPIVQAWINLACCDGLTGSTLGVAVKRGFDASVSWLCSAVIFGGQVVAERTEQRGAATGATGGLSVIVEDFDMRPQGYEIQEQESSVVFPKPIPEVLAATMAYIELGDPNIASRKCFGAILTTTLTPPLVVSHEFQFVTEMLIYIQSRLSDPSTLKASLKSRYLQNDASAVGSFLNLNCGHNNAFSTDERNKLQALLQVALEPTTGIV